MTTPNTDIGASNINNELRDDDNSMILIGGISSNVLRMGATPDGFYLGDDRNSTYTNTLCLTWAKYIKSQGYNPTYASVATDGSGNIYVVGSDGDGNYTSFYRAYIMKFNFKGVLQWEKLYGNNIGFRDVEYDSAGYVYASGISANNSETGVVIYKFAASDGTVQWRKKLVGGNFINGGPIAIRPIGNGNVYFASYRDGYIIKYNYSGALQWQKQLSSPGALDINSLIVDSSENIYIAGRYSTTMNDVKSRGLIVKLTSAGAITWQKQLLPDGTSGTIEFKGVDVDSSGNVYVNGNYSSNLNSYTGVVTIKYDSSATIQWQKQLLPSTNSIYSSSYAAKTLKLDSSANSYCIAYNQSAMYIYKYGVNGGLQFRKTAHVNPGNIGMSPFQGYGIVVDSTYFYGVGATSSGDTVLLKMTLDGGVDMSWLDASYLSSTNGTPSNPTFTSSNSSLTIANPSLTASNASDTSISPSFARNIFLIPQ